MSGRSPAEIRPRSWLGKWERGRVRRIACLSEFSDPLVSARAKRRLTPNHATKVEARSWDRPYRQAKGPRSVLRVAPESGSDSLPEKSISHLEMPPT